MSDIEKKEFALARNEMRDLIRKFESEIRLKEQLEIEIVHHFSPGVYAREMRMPRGSLVVGKIHRHENMNILSFGEVSVLSIEGNLRLKAPYHIVSCAGVKRVLYAHTDVVWTTIHGTGLRDLDEIEKEFISPDYDEEQS